MAKKLKILIFPDPRLRKVAKKVTKFDKSLENLANDMLETMYVANGIGLAATQVDRHIRLIVMDLSEERDDPRIFINPTFKILKNHKLLILDESTSALDSYTESQIINNLKEICKQDNIPFTPINYF